MTLRALSTAATGMQAQSVNVDVIANNLSNVNTTGFKKMKANFEDLLYQQIRSVGTTTATGTRIPVGSQVGVGVRLVGTQRYFEQGSLDNTGRKLTAIQGDGFFQLRIDTQGTIGYSRDGTPPAANGGLWTPTATCCRTSPSTPPSPDNISIGRTDGWR